MRRMLAACCLGLTLMVLTGAGSTALGQTGGGLAGAVVMDTNAIHAAYLDGDFETATADLNKAIAGNALHSRSDSVFAFKHLGVMAAANPETREKGKYYMVQLLNLEPSIKILDMYASDMIYMIFKNLKEEYEENRMKLRRAESHVAGNRSSNAGNASDSAATAAESEARIAAAWNASHPPGPFPSPASATATANATAASSPAEANPVPAAAASPASKRPGFKKWIWIGSAGAVLVGAGITTYLLEKKPESDKVTYVVD